MAETSRASSSSAPARRVMCCRCRRVLVAPQGGAWFKCPACYALMSQKGIKVDEGTAQRVSAGAPDAAVYRPPNNNMAAVQAAAQAAQAAQAGQAGAQGYAGMGAMSAQYAAYAQQQIARAQNTQQVARAQAKES